MLTFKSIEDLLKLDPSDEVFPIIEELVQRLCVDIVDEGFLYIPEDHGWINLVEPIDMSRVITEIWDDWTLLNVEWEAVTKQGNYLIACFLCDNEKGFLFIIPDEDWLNDELREILEEHLDP